MKEKFLYHGAPLEKNALIGTPVNINGRTGIVIENTVLTITVLFDEKPSWLRQIFDKVSQCFS